MPAAHLREGMTPADQDWLADRFRVAAKKRFQGLLTATALQNPSVSPHMAAAAQDRRAQADSPAAIAAYNRCVLGGGRVGRIGLQCANWLSQGRMAVRLLLCCQPGALVSK